MKCNLQCSSLLPPANKVCEDYVFPGVCLSTGLGGGSLSRGVSVWEAGLCPGRVSIQRVSLSRSVSVQGVSLQGESLSRGGVSVQSWGLRPWGSLPERPPCTVSCGRYAPYWNAFLLFNFIHIKLNGAATFMN